MTNEERVQKFKEENIAVNCETNEEAKSFVQWCYANDITWSDSIKCDTYFEVYPTYTCYIYRNTLYVSSEDSLKGDGYKVITYKEFMEEDKKKMTNFEYHYEELKRLSKNTNLTASEVVHIFNIKNYGVPYQYLSLFLQWLISEHKDPIKLSQFEYDLLMTNDMSHDRKLNSFATYRNLKDIGYFQNVDLNLTINQVLENYEVIN